MRRRLVALLVVHLTSIVGKELAALLRKRLALVLVIAASVVVHQ